MMKTMLASAAAVALTAGMAVADYTLTVLHTNDFHARFEPISKYDSGCGEEDNAEGKCFGGSARLVTAITEARARSENSILVDGGDQFQGTLFYTYYKGKLAAEMMNKMGYTAMTVGNHEFDDGPEVLRGFVDAVNFPILMSNADISGEALLLDVIQKSVVIEQAGEKIGLIGLTPEDTDELASPGPNVIFSDPSEAVQIEVDRLTAMVGDTAIVQAYAYDKFLGELNVTFDDDGRIVEAVGEPLIMDGSVGEDGATKERISEAAEPLEAIRNQVVAMSAAAIEGDRSVCRVQECEMGNLVADAMLARVADQGVQIAIANSGGLRASIDAGEVTMGEVLTVLPFQNTLATFQISGQGVIDALENSVSQVEEVAGRFAQVAGLKYTWDPKVAPNEGRIVEVLVAQNGGYAPIDPAALYSVVTNNYVRNGGDGYKMFRDGLNAYDYGPGLEVVLAEFMAAQGSYEPYLDGRISVK